MIKLIIATSDEASNFAIGKDNKLLAHIPEDLAYFKKQTDGQAVALGRKTFDSINEMLKSDKGLPNRKNIIISREQHMSFMSVGSPLWVTSCEGALRFTETTTHYKDLWVIGGASIYEQMLPYVEEVHHTVIEGAYPDADTHFDMSFLSNGEWKIYSKEKLCDKATVCVWRRV